MQVSIMEVTLCFLTISSPNGLSSAHFNPAIFATTTLRLLLLSFPSIPILPNLVFVLSIIIFIYFSASFDTAGNTPILQSSFFCFFYFRTSGVQNLVEFISLSSVFLTCLIFFIYLILCFLW